MLRSSSSLATRISQVFLHTQNPGVCASHNKATRSKSRRKQFTFKRANARFYGGTRSAQASNAQARARTCATVHTLLSVYLVFHGCPKTMREEAQ
jgi:hypothetical protein